MSSCKKRKPRGDHILKMSVGNPGAKEAISATFATRVPVDIQVVIVLAKEDGEFFYTVTTPPGVELPAAALSDLIARLAASPLLKDAR